MKDYISQLQEKFSEHLGQTAQEYFTNGMNIFHHYREHDSDHAQAAVGMVTIGVEFYLKSFLAHRNLTNIFSEIPQEMRILLSKPESVPRFFKWRNVAFDIHSESLKMIGFEDCMSSFYVFFPHLKQLLLPHATVLAKLRFPSLHGIVPALDGFTLDRAGYTVLSIVEALNNEETFPHSWYSLTEEDKTFLRETGQKRRHRVKQAIARAKESSREILDEPVHSAGSSGWDTLGTLCPVCRAGSILSGYTELAVAEDEDGPYPTLDFFATGFRCDECRLVLFDYEELRLAGMNTLYDRTADIDTWFRESGGLSDWELSQE